MDTQNSKAHAAYQQTLLWPCLQNGTGSYFNLKEANTSTGTRNEFHEPGRILRWPPNFTSCKYMSNISPSPWVWQNLYGGWGITLAIRVIVLAKMKRFCKCNWDLKSVSFELIKREIVLNGYDLSRERLLKGSLLLPQKRDILLLALKKQKAMLWTACGEGSI